MCPPYGRRGRLCGNRGAVKPHQTARQGFARYLQTAHYHVRHNPDIQANAAQNPRHAEEWAAGSHRLRDYDLAPLPGLGIRDLQEFPRGRL